MARKKRMARRETGKPVEDADDPEMLELESDAITAMRRAKLELDGASPIKEARMQFEGGKLDQMLGAVKSVNGAILDSLAAIQLGHRTPKTHASRGSAVVQPSSDKDIEHMMHERLKFRTPASRTQFMAKKILDSYNEEYPDAVLVLEEGIKSKVVMSGGLGYIHINCKVKDMDGNEQLFFAETTYATQPFLVSHSILECGDTGDYSHHQIGCGKCGFDDRVPMYHPRGGYLCGDDDPPAMDV